MKKLILLLVILSGCAGAAAQPNVVIITLDTTRADRMGFLGSKRALTPNLDALARESAVFTRAYAQAPITTVSHASVLTGMYPMSHHVDDFGAALPAGIPTLPELLRARGYRTGAFVGALILDPQNGLAPGFDRGFEMYDAGFRSRSKGESRYETLERRGSDVVARAIRWLNQGTSGRPFFLWVHLFDPHDPYDAPAPFAQKHADPYDAEIAYTDSVLAQLFTALKTRKAWDTTMIAVMADHGEAFGEHGERTHGVFLYDTTIHVPLVMKFPRGRYAGERVNGRVSLVDVAPTVLTVTGHEIPRQMNGATLLDVVSRKGTREAPAYSETKYPANAFGWTSIAALRTGKHLYVRSPQRELYDSSVDPAALKNIAETDRALADRLAQQLANFEKFHSAAATPRPAASADPRLAEKLAALGYASGSGSAGNLTGADPKDKIEVANQLHAATVLMEDHDYLQAIPTLRQIVATDPQVFAAQMKLGEAYFETGQARESIAHLRKATELQKENAQAHYALGRSLMVTGDMTRAAAHLEITVNRLPGWPLAHFLLGSAYAGLRQPDKAVNALRTAARLDAGHYGAQVMLGRILAVEGQPQEGLPYLERAALLRPDSREAFRFLGDCYQQLGRTEEAARARAKAAALPAKRPAPGPSSNP